MYKLFLSLYNIFSFPLSMKSSSWCMYISHPNLHNKSSSLCMHIDFQLQYYLTMYNSIEFHTIRKNLLIINSLFYIFQKLKSLTFNFSSFASLLSAIIFPTNLTCQDHLFFLNHGVDKMLTII